MTPSHTLPEHKIPWENNLVIVRYLLALIVLVNHCAFLTGPGGALPLSSLTAVGGFFAISGFLIFPSFQKLPKVKPFLSRRFRRLMPAYIFIVLVCALAFSAVSSLSLGQYFSSGGFWKYLTANLPCLNFLAPDLPGVFSSNPDTAVDGALWTMKIQWLLYLCVPLLFWLLKRLKSSPWALMLLLIVGSLVYKWAFLELYSATGRELYFTLARQVGGMASYFCIGVLIYLYLPQFLRLRWPILIVCLALIPFARIIPGFYFFIEPIVVGTLVIWLSIIGSWGKHFRHIPDLSFEIYLYHWPLIQLFISLGIYAVWPYPWFLALVITSAVALSIVAYVFVERPLKPARL